MRIVGLTGGIASGKSTIANLFKSHGIPVVDADVIARDVLKKGTGGWKKVVAAFGKDILLPDGEVDRPKLGRIIFSDPEKRQILNRMDRWTNPIVVVWVDPETQLHRLMARDGTTEEDAKSRINSQMSLDLKRTKADILLDNTGSLADLNENFQKVLVQVTKPLTWTEFALSRQGAIVASIFIFIGVIICRKIL